MKKGWLRDRLVPAKKNSPMWRSFADSVQELLESNVEPTLDRLRSRTSLFTMNVEDLKVVLNELGSFFVIGSGVKDDDLPIVIMQREDEIHQKRTIYPLINTLNREFEGLDVAWEPFYAPVDMVTYPYCSQLIIKEDLENQVIPAEDWFLTSRGVVRVKLSDVLSVFVGGGSTVESDDPLDDFENQLKRVIYPLIPLRIVCDGTLYFIDFDDVDEADEWPEIVEDRVWHDIDIDEADENGTLDESISIPEFDSGYQERDPVPLEFYTMDKHGIDALNLDYNYELLLSIPDFIFTNNIITPNEEYGYQHRDSNGKIKPPIDNWKPKGDVDYIDTLYRNSIYYFRFRQIELNKWKNFDAIDIRAESESGEELKLVAVKYSESSKSYGISDRSTEDDNQAKQWYDFLHRNVDQEISVWVSKGIVVPEITQQPTDAVGRPGDIINITADADEYDSVRWQVRPSSSPTWRDIPGATNIQLTITAEQAIDGYQYRAIFKKDGEATTEIVSFYIGDFIITVGQFSVGSGANYGYKQGQMGDVIQSPRKWVVNNSTSVDVNALFSSTGTWFFSQALSDTGDKWNNVDYITVTYRDPSDDSKSVELKWISSTYRVESTDMHLWLRSKYNKKLVVSISDAPIITQQPLDQTTTEGESPTFTSNGKNYASIQWQVSLKGTEPWKDIAGATDKNLTFDNVPVDDSDNKYRVAYTNTSKTVYSNEVTLTVLPIFDFIILPGEATNIYGYEFSVSGEIKPSSDNWKATGYIGRITAQYFDDTKIYWFFLERGLYPMSWNGYQAIDVKAFSNSGEKIELSNIDYSGKLYFARGSKGSDYETWYNFLKNNVGKEIRIRIEESQLTNDKPKPTPIKR
ncbi:TPA: hypothetical protein ACX6QP_002155 [Photobacterium damselae]